MSMALFFGTATSTALMFGFWHHDLQAGLWMMMVQVSIMNMVVFHKKDWT